MKEHLQTHFENLGIEENAIQWLLDVWDAIQLFDDIADGDDVKRSDLDKTLFNSFVGFNQNPFFSTNFHALNGLLNVALIKWQASDVAERDGEANAHSFMWRAGYYDLVVYCVVICKGYQFAQENSKYLMNMYGESYEEYMKEFNNA